MEKWYRINRYVRALIVLALVCVALAITILIALKNAQDARDNREKQRSGLNNTADEVINIDVEMRQVSSSSNDIPAEEKRSEQEIRIVDDWFRKTGFSTELERNYENQYSDDQLRELANKGDIIAINTLANRLTHRDINGFFEELARLRDVGDMAGIDKLLEDRENRGKQEFDILLDKGVVYGSLGSIRSLMSSNKPHFSTDDTPAIRYIQQQRLKDYLAYLGLLDLRGGKQLHFAHVDERIVLEHYKTHYNSSLSEQDLDEISQRSQKLYEEFQLKRYELGLGDFDNELPPEVKKFMDID